LSVAYVDTSVLAAIVFGEPEGPAAAKRLRQSDNVVSSNLLEAELRSIAHREKVELDADLLRPIGWILPERPLTLELKRILRIGYARGSDLWHLACALYLFEAAKTGTFLTLDERQRDLAERLGFRTV
jgi:predicted nucleic acid-binding protein